MKLKILKDRLNESIQHVSKAITNKTAHPILQGIKIEANVEGITLSASDSDISIQSFIAAEENDRTVIELERPGSVVLPARFFSEIIRKLPHDQAEIEVKELFNTVIRSGTVEIQIVGLDPDEFPSLPQIDSNKMVTIPSELLKTLIRQTVFAVSTSETTPILTGVLWQLSDGILKFTGCDRHRLACSQARFETNTDVHPESIVIAGRTLNELAKLLPDQNTLIDICFSDNQVLLKINSILFYTSVLEGTYPDTSRLIPQTFQTELVIDTKMLADSIDRAYLLSKEDKSNIVRLDMKEDRTIEISSASSEIGKVTEQLQTNELNGERLKISFNSKYMLDALKVVDSEQIFLGFNGPTHPIVIKPLHSADHLQLILPYRTIN